MDRDDIPQHTPGPWAYEPTSGAIFYADGAVEPLIASTNLECVSVEQGDADGRLIAAAPELLEALTELWEYARGLEGIIRDGVYKSEELNDPNAWAGCDDWAYNGEGACMRNQVEAAIAKAQGSTHD